MSSDQPFDHGLYDAVMAKELEPIGAHAGERYYAEGYKQAAKYAARLAAERVPVSDEELLDIFVRSRNEYFAATISDDHVACDLAGIRAVRAAIAPQPVIPERLDHVEIEKMDDGGWRCVTHWAGSLYRHDFFGATPFDALTAACEAAKDGDR